MKRFFLSAVFGMLISSLALGPVFSATEIRMTGMYTSSGLGVTGDHRLGNTCVVSTGGRTYCGLNASHLSFFADNTVSLELLYQFALAADNGVNTYCLKSAGDNTFYWGVCSSSTGDVVGPASATDNGVALFSGTTGKLLKTGRYYIDVAVDNAWKSGINGHGFRMLNPYAWGGATTGGRITLTEATDNGSNAVIINAPVALADNVTFTLPSAAAEGEGYLLNVGADGTMGYTSPATFADAGNLTSGVVAVARGGTGSGTLSTARTNLGLGSGDNVTFGTVTAGEYVSSAADNTRGAAIGNTADPTTTNLAAGKIWYNKTTNLLKVRNGDNTATLEIFTATSTNTGNFYTTGTLNGGQKTVAKTDNVTLSGVEVYGTWIEAGAGCDNVTLPAVSANMSVCVMATDNVQKRIIPNGSDAIIYLDGTDFGNGHFALSAPAGATAPKGEFLCLKGSATANKWRTTGRGATAWTDGGAP